MTRSARTACWAGLASAAVVLSVRPLVSGTGWLVPALAVVAAVTGTGLLVRALTRRPGLAAGVQLLVLLGAVLVLFGGSTTVLGVVPTSATPARLAQLFGDGVQVVRSYSVPAVDLRGLRLLLVAGAGLTAWAVDLLAVALRHPALAGVPLAAVYAVPVVLAPGGSSGWALALVAVPYLVLLVTAGDGRRRWAGSARAGVRSARTAAAAGTGAVALVAAVAVPAAVPGLDERALTFGGGGGDTIAVINPILNLKASLGARSDATILSYETDEDDPEPLRIVTADVFDGQTWAPSTGADIPRRQRVQDGLSDPPGMSGAVREQSAVRRTSIAVRGLDQTYLPLPYPSTRVEIDGDWLYETSSLNVVGDGETTRGRTYTATHLEVRPTEEQLRTAPPAPGDVQEVFTALPEGLPEVVFETAREVTAGAADAYERAALMQRWFRSTGGFTYSTTAPNDGGSDAVAAFLQEKSGFCVQYASAMAVMARTLGIPARVAIGFLPGEEVSDGRWRISAQDAHAWPELWFSGVGWVRFEPTPATRTGQSPSYSQPRTPVTPVTPNAPAAAPQGPGPSADAPAPEEETSAAEAGGAAGADGELTGWQRVAALPWGWLALGLAALVALLLPAASAAALTRRRWRGAVDGATAAEAAWAELVDRTRDLGAQWPASATPRQSAAALGRLVDLPGQAQEDLARVRRAVEGARYGAGSRPSAPGAGGTGVLTRAATGGRLVRADVDAVVAAVARQRPAAVRWRARLLPTAGLRALLAWWDRG
ncbi:transglutaminase family protein [Kineococcus terrestris]|uniref:transglutaminase family protein n=1 Tax=Kineococcus terrestris TaxID=2044856 RepID=UPI0034DB583C